MRKEILELLQQVKNGVNLDIKIIDFKIENNDKKYEEYKNIIFSSIELLDKIQNYTEDDKLSLNLLSYLKTNITNLRNCFTYYNSNIDSFNMAESNVNNVYKQIQQNNKNCITFISKLNFDISTIELLEFYNKNVVFIGANGSGKTTFANKLKEHFKSHCVGISAQKILHIPNNSTIENTTSTNQKLKASQQKDISNKNNNFVTVLTSDFSILLKNLFAENTLSNHNLKTKALTTGENYIAEKSILDDVLDIWNELIEHRNISTDGMNLIVSCDDCDDYNANQMSDGEKVVLYSIGQVLSAPKDGFIIIDEPEIFLNKNILNRLWNKLENLRSDCKFIYLTHDLDFAINRNEALKIWIKSYVNEHTFYFSKIEDSDIPERLIMELLGSQKNILFCEGKNNDSSYDIKILSVLFPHFNIIPVESCFNVINYTKAFNNMPNISIKAYGLIDSDFHTEQRLDSLEEDNIHYINFSEIENLCLEENLFKELAISISSPPNSFEIHKKKVFNILRRDEVLQASRFVTTKIDYHYKDSHISKSNTLEQLNENFQEFNNPINIEEWYKERLNKIDEIISSQNYNKAIKIFNNKGLSRQTAEQALNITDYMDRVIRYLNNNKNSCDSLKTFFHENLKS